MKKLSLKFWLISSILTIYLSCKKEETSVIRPNISLTPQNRVYYIAAEEVEWDYAASGLNMFMGRPFDEMDSVFAAHIPYDNPTPRIGSKYIKARYVQYTDNTFTTKVPMTEETQHLGLLGPIIRANVGDSILVYFKNNSNIHASIHPHGVVYDANSEGAMYNNGAISGAMVEPGDTYIFKYYVREESGPGPAEGSSKVWLYHSHVEMDESDLYAGLIGAIIINRQGVGTVDAKAFDIDREFITLFMVMNENMSSYYSQNISLYLPGFTNPEPEDFEESNLKHCINGTMMGNLNGLEMNAGERVRWYVIALGNEVDLHTPHWHGNTVNHNGEYTDVIELLPASMVTVDMTPYNRGTWGFHCHVSDHAMAGMSSLYRVN